MYIKKKKSFSMIKKSKPMTNRLQSISNSLKHLAAAAVQLLVVARSKPLLSKKSGWREAEAALAKVCRWSRNVLWTVHKVYVQMSKGHSHIVNEVIYSTLEHFRSTLYIVCYCSSAQS